MKHSLALVATCMAVCFGAVDMVRADKPAPEFAQHIAPLLTKYCVGCHEGEDGESGLGLESYAALMTGGERGPALLPGRGRESRLVLMIRGDVEPRMPPDDDPGPTDEELALLVAWIDAGAKGPDGEMPDPATLNVPHIEPTRTPRRPIQAIAYQPPAGELIAVAEYQQVRLLSAANRGTVARLEGHAGNVNALVFSADGTLLAAAAGEPGLFGEVSLWRLPEATLISRFRGHANNLYSIALSPDGTLLATGSYDQQIKLWNTETGEELATLEGHNDAVYALAFGRHAQLLASASGDRTVKLWDVGSRQRLETFGQSAKELYALAFSPDGQRIAAGGVDNRIRIWQISPSAAEGTNVLLEPRFAHEGALLQLAFSPDGRWLASSADDRTVKLWQADPLEERHLWAKQSDWAVGLAFSPDSTHLAIARLDGSLEVREVESGQVVTPAAPVLASIEPRAVQRGVATRVRLRGEHLGGIQEIALAGRTIAFQSQPQGVSDGTSVWIDVTAPADLEQSSYELSVTTLGGTSDKVSIEVDELPQFAEVEPNNLPKQAPEARLPASFWGALPTAGDVDHYSFLAEAGQTLVFDVRADRQKSKLDAVLTLGGASGEVLASNNDYEGSDSLLAYTFAEAGQYTIRVSDLRYTGSEEHFYQLTAGEIPYVTGCYPTTVTADGKSPVELVGYNLPEDAHVSLEPSDAGREIDVPLDRAAYRFREAPKVKVVDGPLVVEQEPNGSIENATRLPAPGTAAGRIFAGASAASGAEASDADLYRFSAKAGERWIVETDAARRGSPVDTMIEVLDAQGELVPRLLLQAVRDSNVTFRGIDSRIAEVRVVNWEEMELNQYLYMQGEVCKLFRHPRGPDSGFQFYTWSGARIAYFNSSPTAHPLDEPCYIVQPLPIGAKPVPNGLPVFTQYYNNDDDGWRKAGNDSYVEFVAPADSDYFVRISDTTTASGSRYSYSVRIRRPQPDFAVTVSLNRKVAQGGGSNVVFTVDRRDGFDGPVQIEVTNLPAGFELSAPITVEAGHFEAAAVLYAATDAEQKTFPDAGKIVARAQVGDREVAHDAGNLGQLEVVAPGKLAVRLEPVEGDELVITPGSSVPARLVVERRDFDDRISFEVANLPHGVIVDDIGLNGVLITEELSERRIFLTARDWVAPTARWVHAVTNNAGGQASPPVRLRVQPPTELARGEAEQ